VEIKKSNRIKYKTIRLPYYINNPILYNGGLYFSTSTGALVYIGDSIVDVPNSAINDEVPIDFSIEISLKGHEGDIESLHFSPDNRYLASSAGDDTMRLWDLTTGNLIRSQYQYGGVPKSQVSFTPDSKLVLLRSEEFTAWNTSDGALAKTFSIFGRIFTLSSDGAMIGADRGNGEIGIWKVDDGSLIRAIETERDHSSEGSRFAFAFSPDGKIIAADEDTGRKLVLYSVETGNIIDTFQSDAPIRTIVFSEDGNDLYVGTDRDIYGWNIVTHDPLPWPQNIEGNVIVRANNREVMATMNRDGEIKVWHMSTSQVINEFTSATSITGEQALAVSPNGRMVAFEDPSTVIRVVVINP
jgi:WD40 repeat protein